MGAVAQGPFIYFFGERCLAYGKYWKCLQVFYATIQSILNMRDCARFWVYKLQWPQEECKIEHHNKNIFNNHNPRPTFSVQREGNGKPIFPYNHQISKLVQNTIWSPSTYWCLKEMIIAVQLSLHRRSRMASLTRWRLTAATDKPSCQTIVDFEQATAFKFIIKHR